MPFCRKCGAEISDLQFNNSNKMCQICFNLNMTAQSQEIDAQRLAEQKMTARKTKAKIKDRRFLILLGIALLGITALGTAVVMGIHYSIITSYIDSEMKFGEFFIENFIPDTFFGFFVGLAIVIVCVIITAISD